MSLNTLFSQVFHYMLYKHSSKIHYCLTWINTGNAVGCIVACWKRDHLKNSAFGAVALLSTDSSSASPVLASLVLLLVQKGIIAK